MTAEQFIKDYTRTDSNELIAIEDIHGKTVISYREWLTPEQALRAVELGRNDLWKSADGDDLPEIDREVIVLYQPHPEGSDYTIGFVNNEYAVGFGHRPKEYWDGKNMATGEVTRYYPKRYDKGGWNSPNIKYWLDLDLPMEE